MLTKGTKVWFKNSSNNTFHKSLILAYKQESNQYEIAISKHKPITGELYNDIRLIDINSPLLTKDNDFEINEGDIATIKNLKGKKKIQH